MSNDDSGRWALVTVTDNAGSPFDPPRRAVEVRPADFTFVELLDRVGCAMELEGKPKD